ncbi:MAG: hypothetical protein NTV04_04875, partial [Deltaproteobacteria bacterium]|nr:hypothetical protein [Deltaproteobacteria bacterium]
GIPKSGKSHSLKLNNLFPPIVLQPGTDILRDENNEFINDGFVKGSRCKARKSDGRGNPPGCPISGGSASRPYLLQRRSCSATPQMDFLRDHQE